MDVVYALGSGSCWQNNELRYSLRSIEENILNLGNVYVVGICPEWLGNVIHIPAQDPFNHNKDGNIISKVLKECSREELTKNFLFMNDDYVILNKVIIEDMKGWYINMMDQYKDCWYEKNAWNKAVKRTMDYLKSKNLPLYHYDGAHCPQLYNKYTFQKVMNMVGWNGESCYTISNLYLNVTGAEPGNVIRIKATFQDEIHNMDIIKKKCANAIFMSYNNSGLTDELKVFLQETFPDKSKYEK